MKSRAFTFLLVRCLVLPSLLASPFCGQGQNDGRKGTSLIQHYLDNGQNSEADKELSLQIVEHVKARAFDSLAKYPYYIGIVKLRTSTKEKALRQVGVFMERLRKLQSDDRTLMEAYRSSDDFYYEIDDTDKSLEATQKMLYHTKRINNVTLDELGRANYAVGSSYHAQYDLVSAKKYFHEAVEAYKKSMTVPGQTLADAYNGLAISYWDLGKLDSAKTAFEKAIKAMDKSTLEPDGKLYYLTAFNFNIALVHDDLGNLDEAIEISREVIANCREIIKNSKNEHWIDKANFQEAIAISNLAAFYHDSGFLARSLDLHQIAYARKKAIFGASHPRSINNLLQIATVYLSLRDFERCLETCELVLDNLDATSDDLIYFQASVYHTRAKAYYQQGKTNLAGENYGRADDLFRQFFAEGPGREYRVFLRDYALFLAIRKQPLALEKAQLVYGHVLKNGGEDKFPILKSILTMAEVNYILGDYRASIQWAEKGNDHVKDNLINSTSSMDSLKIEFHRPDLLLLEAKAQYRLIKTPTENQLKEIDKALKSAMEILEHRKTVIVDEADMSYLLSSFRSISEFSKELNFGLYELTQNPMYLEEVVSLHESGIYNRIRSRLNLRRDIAFTGIPSRTLEREKKLRKQLVSVVNDPDESILGFFAANGAWEQFLDSVSSMYPKYFKMRYGTIRESLTDLREHISDNTTVVRYFFIGENLFAYVLGQRTQQLVPLDGSGAKERIDTLNVGSYDVRTMSKTLNDLYGQLWKPIESLVNTQKVVIVPDRELFNLSFELLTTRPIASFEELPSHSLLTKHVISYRYSLLLLDGHQKTFKGSENYIAFAPGFNEKMKTDYEMVLMDSMDVDKTYIKLSSLPFSENLAKQYSKKFDGRSFLNEQASKQLFASRAKEHKIIHIGTHAESNNIRPELSRLIFAKNLDDDLDLENNSLYTYEIYNLDLSSNLAVLTGCETGRPSYQAGEGMISLAHAFNYAGSNSMLTSLWEVDEQSSTQIVGFFYENLYEGMTKDEALQQAKLSYLRMARGRALAPRYWGGLILVGETGAISLESNAIGWFWWILLGISLILVIIFVSRYMVYNKRKNYPQKNFLK